MRAVLVVVLVALLSGCLSSFREYHDFPIDDQYENPAVFPGQYQMNGGDSLVLRGGRAMPIPFPEVVRLTSDLPAFMGPLSERPEAEVEIVMAIWRPNVTYPVPVIVDAGPYYEVGVHCKYANQDPCTEWVDDTIDWPGQRTPMLRSNFIGHGYAVVQLAVRGTGTAGGCMDLMGPSEQHDLVQALEWLGTQPWSNGRIGMIGASYDGSTPWIAAASGTEYLKAIVPTSGLPDIYDLMFHNGSAETRGPLMHNLVYYGYGYSDEFPQRPGGWPEQLPWLPSAGIGQANGRTMEQDLHHALCPEIIEASAVGGYSTVSGSRGAEASTYWAERDYTQRVIDNYDGGIFLVHGLQDWNVDPHAAIPFNRELRDAGFDMIEWYGQWGHSFPDSNCIAAAPEWAVLPCRIDFAENLLRFFERHLKGDMAIEQGPPVQVQDNIGFWRMLDEYPSRDVAWQELELSFDGTLKASGAEAGSVDLMPPGATGGPGQYVRFATEPLGEDLVISGLPQLKLPFDVKGQGGHIGAWIFDEDPRGLVRAPAVAYDNVSRTWSPYNLDHLGLGVPVVGHAQMNLRYHAGGEEQQALVPGEVYEAQVEFEPLEVRVPAGNRLVLWVFQYQTRDHFPAFTQSPVTVHLGDDARLRLPVPNIDPRTIYPVPGAHFLNQGYVPEMYTTYPDVPGFVPTDAPRSTVAIPTAESNRGVPRLER